MWNRKKLFNLHLHIIHNKCIIMHYQKSNMQRMLYNRKKVVYT